MAVASHVFPSGKKIPSASRTCWQCKQRWRQIQTNTREKAYLVTLTHNIQISKRGNSPLPWIQPGLRKNKELPPLRYIEFMTFSGGFGCYWMLQSQKNLQCLLLTFLGKKKDIEIQSDSKASGESQEPLDKPFHTLFHPVILAKLIGRNHLYIIIYIYIHIFGCFQK